MPVKEGKGSVRYMPFMISALFRVVAAMSLLLMPLGMTQAADISQTAAAEAPTHAMVEAGHCADDEEPGKAPASPHHHCAACSAVPSLDSPLASIQPAPKASLTAEPADLLSGLALEIATPPPRQG